MLGNLSTNEDLYHHIFLLFDQYPLILWDSCKDVKYELLRPDISPPHDLQQQPKDENANSLFKGKNKERSLEEAVNENEDYAYNEKNDNEDLNVKNDENHRKENENYELHKG